MTANYSIREQIEEHFEFHSETLKVRGKTKRGQGTVNRLHINDVLQIEARKFRVMLALPLTFSISAAGYGSADWRRHRGNDALGPA